MARVLSLEFSFLHVIHSALIQVIEKPDKTEFHVTILNSELDKLLSGNNVIIEKNGLLQIDPPLRNHEQENLKLAIKKALSEHLHLY